MRSWEVIFSDASQVQIARLDRAMRARVLDKISWLQENFEKVVPISLSANLTGLYKLRAGDYRVVYALDPMKCIIYIKVVEHRSRIYGKR